MKKIQDGSIDPLRMVSHRVALEELETVYQKYNEREKGMQKVFVATKFSFPPSPGAPQLTTYNS